MKQKPLPTESTTTSKQLQLPKPSRRSRTAQFSVFNNSRTHAARNMLGVDVTGNSRMTMSTQLQPEAYVMMKL